VQYFFPFRKIFCCFSIPFGYILPLFGSFASSCHQAQSHSNQTQHAKLPILAKEISLVLKTITHKSQKSKEISYSI